MLGFRVHDGQESVDEAVAPAAWIDYSGRGGHARLIRALASPALDFAPRTPSSDPHEAKR